MSSLTSDKERVMSAYDYEVDAKGWQDLANCLGIDPEFFFPGPGASARKQKEICGGCVVREECLEYALANGEKFGIWGGLTERERRRIGRQRRLLRSATIKAEAISGEWDPS